MWQRLVLSGVKKSPTRDAVAKAIQQSGPSQHRGPRRGWQVKAAAWVKKAHIDRGDKKVGLHSATGFHIIEDLRPRYIVPDLTDCKLRPYVAYYKMSAAAGATSASNTSTDSGSSSQGSSTPQAAAG